MYLNIYDCKLSGLMSDYIVCLKCKYGDIMYELFGATLCPAITALTLLIYLYCEGKH